MNIFVAVIYAVMVSVGRKVAYCLDPWNLNPISTLAESLVIIMTLEVFKKVWT